MHTMLLYIQSGAKELNETKEWSTEWNGKSTPSTIIMKNKYGTQCVYDDVDNDVDDEEEGEGIEAVGKKKC